jgi:ubiquinone/menaquinone biosynthesis C-methylase UbiE
MYEIMCGGMDASSNVHEVLVDLANPRPKQVVADLGCGAGATLASFARRQPQAHLLGLDVDEQALSRFRSNVGKAFPIRADLSRGLPLALGSIDIVICHNVLESLVDRIALLVEVAGVLRPGGRAVIGHTDFESMVITADDRDLSRRVCLSYAELTIPYRTMATADGQMGRWLPALVRRSAMELITVHAHVGLSTSLTGIAEARVLEMAAAVNRMAQVAGARVTGAEVGRWLQDLRAVDARGDFLFSETAYLVLAERIRS